MTAEQRIEQEHIHTFNAATAFFYTGGEDVYLVVACDFTLNDGTMCNKMKTLKGTPLVFG